MLDELTTGLDPQARRDTWELIEQVRARGVTIVLVTHFMEEAERLCDRVALIDAGRVVVVDTPAGLTERVQTEQRIQFRPSVPFEDELLTRLPRVRPAHVRGGPRRSATVAGGRQALRQRRSGPGLHTKSRGGLTYARSGAAHKSLRLRGSGRGWPDPGEHSPSN